MSKTLEELGYEKREDTPSKVLFIKDDFFAYHKISFYKGTKDFTKTWGDYDAEHITMEELKAIYKYCEDNKWI